MKITTVQWNIGGGKVLNEESDPTLLASYERDGLDDIIAVLQKIDTHIITLQEVHRGDDTNQAEYIAEALGMKYCVSDFYADSHIEEGQKLGHAILSNFPISNHAFTLYDNPQLKIVWEDGSIATTHDKGFTACDIDVDGILIKTVVTHLIPFPRFEVKLDSMIGQNILKDIQSHLIFSDDNVLIQGDFNIDSNSLRQWLPRLFEQGLDEVLQINATTPKDQRLDHVLYKGIKAINSEVDPSVKTDHFPVVTHFEVN